MVDMVVHRHELRDTLSNLISLLMAPKADVETDLPLLAATDGEDAPLEEAD